MTIKEYLAVVRRRWMIVVLTVGICAATALTLGLRQTPIYEAAIRVELYPQVGTGQDAIRVLRDQYAYKNVNVESEIMKSTVVAQRVLDLLAAQLKGTAEEGLGPDALISRVSIKPKSNVLYIGVKSLDPAIARDLANAYPEAYFEIRQDQILAAARKEAGVLTARLRVLAVQLSQLETALDESDRNTTRFLLVRQQLALTLSEISGLERKRAAVLDRTPLKNELGAILQPAFIPAAPTTESPVRTGVLGLIVGIPLAVGLALLVETMSDTIKTKEEAEKVVGADTLAVIPLSPDWRTNKPYIVTKDEPYSGAAEAYRTLRINLDSTIGDTGEGMKILFTSPGIGEGKTLATANLAMAYAEAGRSTLLVSADLRRPRLHVLLNVDRTPGLAEVIQGEAVAEDVMSEPHPNLYFLPSGSPSERPDRLINQTDVGALLSDLVLPAIPEEDATRRPGDGQGSYGRKPPTGAGTRPRARSIVGVQPGVVILDSPSVLGAGAEVSALAASVDGVVLVLQAGVSRRQAAARAAEQIRRGGAKIIGILLVGARSEEDYGWYSPAGDDVEHAPQSTWAKVVAGLRR